MRTQALLAQLFLELRPEIGLVSEFNRVEVYVALLENGVDLTRVQAGYW
jgi:hypothetical protein